MDAFFQRLLGDAAAQGALRHLLDQAMQQFYTFTLVAARISGLLAIGPLFGQSVLPANIRILSVLALSLLITPTLHHQTHVAVDGDDVQAAPAIPASLVDYARIGVTEFAVGLVLGLGVFTVLTGLQVAGHLIDQQTGLALGDIVNPSLQVTGSVTGQFLFLFGVTVVLLMEPTGGHLLMVSALVDSFHTLPVGQAVLSVSAVDLLRDLVHQSLILGVQVAAPLLATMSLVALTVGFLGRTVPQVNVLVVGFPVRALVTLLVLALTFSGASRAVVDLVPSVIDQLRDALTVPP